MSKENKKKYRKYSIVIFVGVVIIAGLYFIITTNKIDNNLPNKEYVYRYDITTRYDSNIQCQNPNIQDINIPDQLILIQFSTMLATLDMPYKIHTQDRTKSVLIMYNYTLDILALEYYQQKTSPIISKCIDAGLNEITCNIKLLSKDMKVIVSSVNGTDNKFDVIINNNISINMICFKVPNESNWICNYEYYGYINEQIQNIIADGIFEQIPN